jgi:hypothetical protein
MLLHGRVFPCLKQEPKKGAIENTIREFRGEYRISIEPTTLLKKSEMFDDALAGMRHSIPVTTNFKVLIILVPV